MTRMIALKNFEVLAESDTVLPFEPGSRTDESLAPESDGRWNEYDSWERYSTWEEE